MHRQAADLYWIVDSFVDLSRFDVNRVWTAAKNLLGEIGMASAASLWEQARSAHVTERAAAYAYELQDEGYEELERIMSRARRELG